MREQMSKPIFYLWGEKNPSKGCQTFTASMVSLWRLQTKYKIGNFLRPFIATYVVSRSPLCAWWLDI